MQCRLLAKKNGKNLITAESVQRAVDESIYRENLLEERIQERILQDTVMIDVEGARIGQINALSVISLGDYDFGRPSRVTASVSPGRSGITSIDRDAHLGGSIHTKGFLIISNYLNRKYGQNKAVNVSASLAFEQSYEEVEGDSASTAELCAVLSAIAGIPIRQERALTGSVNQHGEIQSIGGVNE